MKIERQKKLSIPMFLLSGFAIGCVVAAGLNLTTNNATHQTEERK